MDKEAILREKYERDQDDKFEKQKDFDTRSGIQRSGMILINFQNLVFEFSISFVQISLGFMEIILRC